MEEERLMILKMVEEGKITSEEAAALLEALDEHGERVVISPGEAQNRPEKGEEPIREENGDRERRTGVHIYHHRDDVPGVDALEDIGRRAEHFSERVSKAAEELGERLGKLGEELGERVPNTVFSGLESFFSFDPANHLEERIEGSFEDGPVEILLRNANGSVSVAGWDNEGYRLLLTETVRARNEEEARRRVTKSVVLERGKRSLRFDAGGEYGLNVRLQLWLPRRGTYRVDARSSNGSIVISDVSVDDARLITANGRIQLDGVSGRRLEVGSTNGRIEGSVNSADVTAKTTNGRVELVLHGSSGGRYQVKTTNGRIDLGVPGDWPCELEASNSFGSLQVEMRELVYREQVIGTQHSRILANRPGQGQASGLELRSTCGSIRVHDNAPEGGGQ